MTFFPYTFGVHLVSLLLECFTSFTTRQILTASHFYTLCAFQRLSLIDHSTSVRRVNIEVTVEEKQ